MCFLPAAGDVDLFNLEGMESFRNTFAETASTLRRLVMNAEVSSKNLFFFTAFSVADPSLDAFKKELLILASKMGLDG